LSQHYACVDCGANLAEVTPRLFSFNSPYGACPDCSGLGTLRAIDPDRVVVDPERSIDAGAVAPWKSGPKSWRRQMVTTLAEELGFSLETPWQELPAAVRQILLHGSGEEEMTFELKGKKSSYKWRGNYEGVIPRLERRYRETESAAIRTELEKYMSIRPCGACDGRRLRPEALAVKVVGEGIDGLSTSTIGDLRSFFAALELDDRQRAIAGKVIGSSTVPRTGTNFSNSGKSTRSPSSPPIIERLTRAPKYTSGMKFDNVNTRNPHTSTR